jgi:hypothetical protein
MVTVPGPDGVQIQVGPIGNSSLGLSLGTPKQDLGNGVNTGGPTGSGPGAPPPPASGGGGGGGSGNKLVVHTDSLRTVGTNFGTLATRAGAAITALDALPRVAAGQFYMANELASGTKGVAGLKTGYRAVLVAVRNTLLDAQTALGTVANKYTATENINDVKASDLTDAMASITPQIAGIGTAAGALPNGKVS